MRGEKPEPWFGYGSTFRWYSPAIDAWHITWFDPGRSYELRQIGRAVGRDIVQIGESHPGVLRRWRVVGSRCDLDPGNGDARGAGLTLATLSQIASHGSE